MADMVEHGDLERICWEIYGINKRNAHKYPQVRHLGRDAYRWQNCVLKSAPGIWNFLTQHEFTIHQYIVEHSRGDWFPQLIGKIQAKDRLFIALEYLPLPDLQKRFFSTVLGRFRLTPHVIGCIERQGKAIVSELRRLEIIHRDIRPANLLFDSDQQRLVLIDFSFAIRADQGEIKTETREQADLLSQAVEKNLGGKYRTPDLTFDINSDAYSFALIVKHLRQRSLWKFWTQAWV